MSDQPLYLPRQDAPASPGAPTAGIPSYAPPLDPPSFDPPATGASDAGPDSTAEVAKSQAADVVGGAKDAAQDVAGTAKEQVTEVAQEARTQVRNVVGQARAELTEQAGAQQKKVAAGLSSLADQLAAMVAGSDQPGVATDVAQQASEKAQEFAGWLDNRDPQGVLQDVRAFARRKPGVFLVAALGAGVLAGRLARGLSADPDPTPSVAATTPAVQPLNGGAGHQQLPVGAVGGAQWERPGGSL